MDPIRVPRPPKQSFNKNRPISDLLKAQVEHFQHLESKLESRMRSPLHPHELTTESAAANYIAHMTGVLLGESPAPKLLKPARVRSISAPKPKAKTKPKTGLAIAAVGKSGKQAKRSHAKKSVSKPKKSAKGKRRGKKS